MSKTIKDLTAGTAGGIAQVSISHSFRHFYVDQSNLGSGRTAVRYCQSCGLNYIFCMAELFMKFKANANLSQRYLLRYGALCNRHFKK